MHKEKYCVYWHCRHSGGRTCWHWGTKYAGQNCPNDSRCEYYRACKHCNGVMGQCKTYQRVKGGQQ